MRSRRLLFHRPGALTAVTLVGSVFISGCGLPTASAPTRPAARTPGPAPPPATQKATAHAEAVRVSAEVLALYRAGKFAEALPLAEHVVGLAESALGPDHPVLASSLNNLAAVYTGLRRYADAEPLYLRAMATRQRAHGPHHRSLVVDLNNLAVLYMNQKRYPQAEPLYWRALAILESSLGPDHPEVAQSLTNLVSLYSTQGKYGQAKSLAQREVDILERARGPQHPEVASALRYLGAIYLAMSELAQAELASRRSLAILEAAMGPERLEVAAALDNLAAIFLVQGEYAQSEQVSRRALAIREKTLGPEHADVARTLANVAGALRAIGQDAQAERLYQRALAIQETTLGPEDLDVSITLLNLAGIARTRAQYAQAEPLYRRALAIQERARGPDHPTIGSTLDELARIHREQGRHEEAEQLHRRALAILERALGSEHPYLSTSLDGLATLARIRGRYAEAEPLLQRAVAIEEKSLGPEHPNMDWTLRNLATVHWAAGHLDKAIAALTRAAEASERNLALFVASGAEDQKRAYLATRADDDTKVISFHALTAPRDPAALRLALTTVLRRKGRALDAMADTLAIARRGVQPGQEASFDEWVSARKRYAMLTLRGPGERAITEHRTQLATLAARVEQLEARFGEGLRETLARSTPVTVDSVAQAIPANGALVEITSFRPFDPRAGRDPWGATRYVAYVLARNREPAWVDLGDALTIDTEIVRLREALSDPARGDVQVLSRALDERVMRPIRALLGERKMVLISPDGALNLVPFPALVDERGRFLVEQYTFVYLTSGRDLLRLAARRPSRQEAALIVADPDFDDDRGLQATSALTAASSSSSRRSTDHAGLAFHRLPGTADEARVLSGLLPGTRVLTGSAATEAALKQVQAPTILHIATHGFFLADRVVAPETRDVVASRPWTWETSAGTGDENPLLRSGLALAGANRLRSGDEDGVLTALEAAGLNLSGTKLVVLSACETGVGAVQRGEGVYGLRRALVLAGAESQVMSLWKVADEATKDLMAAYYRRLLQDAGRAEALRQAQLQIAANPLRRHPFFWASFILIGDWAPLGDRSP